MFFKFAQKSGGRKCQGKGPLEFTGHRFKMRCVRTVVCFLQPYSTVKREVWSSLRSV